MSTVIQIENMYKLYRLGSIGSGTFYNDLRRFWAKILKNDDTYQILEGNHIQNISGGSDYIWALKDISIKIEEGEILGIIGKNGAGKSTFLKILSRITTPTKGSVKVKGRIASLLEVGTGFHPELTGKENIYLNGAILGMTKLEINRKMDQIIDFSDIERFIDTPVKRYSSGMYVRLAFSVAAHLESDILIVDEVLAVGDNNFQKKCLGKLEDISRGGKTVIFVSHNIPSIQKLCTKVGLISNGRLVHLGTSEEVIKHYFSSRNEKGNNKESKYLYSEDKKIIIQYLGVVNKDGELNNTINSGEDLLLSMQIYSETKFDDIIISFGINTQNDTRVTVLHSKINGIDIHLSTGVNHVNCKVSRFFLFPGLYNLDCKIYHHDKTLIWAPNAGSFQINTTDYFGTGKMPDPSWGGICLVKPKWEINNEGPL